MNKIDLIILAILSFYIITGLRKGFLRTLIGPAALILGTIVGYMYYLKTEDFLWALLISLLAPLTVNLILLIILKILHRTFGKDKKLRLSSRLAGALMASVWSGAWIILTLIFLVITPCNWSWFDRLQNGVLNSRSYAYINSIVGDKIPRTSMSVHDLSEMLENPEKFRVLRNTDEYKELVENQTVRNILTDEETLKQIKNQNVPKLLSNPKFQALLQDRELIKSIFVLNQKLLELKEEGKI